MFKNLFSLENKFFLYLFSQRRNFIPLLSIYFLMLPDTTAQQIGIFMGLGFLASFLLEIPSAYIADRIGHKKALIFSKSMQLFSVLLFIMAYYFSSPGNYYIFCVASITQSVGFSFFSGTTSAFFHEILETQGKGKDFGKIISPLRGRASLLSAFIIVMLPFTTVYHILVPFAISALIDFIGLIVLFFLPETKVEPIIKEDRESIWQIMKGAKKSGALYISIFMGFVIGFLMGENPFRTVYLESLGYAVLYIGGVMGFSRIIWYFVGKYAYKIEEYFTLRQIFFFEMILFPTSFLIISLGGNPYVLGFLFSCIIGYQHGRKGILQGMILNNYLHDSKYKATILSIESFVNSLTSMTVTFIIGYIMSISYQYGYMSLAFGLFFLLLIMFYLIFHESKTNKKSY